jgi:hypothetical protein
MVELKEGEDPLLQAAPISNPKLTVVRFAREDRHAACSV